MLDEQTHVMSEMIKWFAIQLSYVTASSGAARVTPSRRTGRSGSEVQNHGRMRMFCVTPAGCADVVTARRQRWHAKWGDRQAAARGGFVRA